jgi:hypothetical protein
MVLSNVSIFSNGKKKKCRWWKRLFYDWMALRFCRGFGCSVNFKVAGISGFYPRNNRAEKIGRPTQQARKMEA